MNSSAPRTPDADIWIGAAFLSLGCLFCGATATSLLFSPGFALLTPRPPAVVALQHAAVLGWLLGLGFGLLYLTLSVFARSPRVGGVCSARLHFLLFLVGVLIIVPAFRLWDLRTVAHGGALLLAALLIGGWGLLRQMDRSQRRFLVQETFTMALSWLLVAVLTGLLVTANRYWSFLGTDAVATIHAGAHMGFGGFFLLLLVGLCRGLFAGTGEPPAGETRIWTDLFLNGGIFIACFGLLFGFPLVPIGGTLVLVGILLFLGEVWIEYRRLDLGSQPGTRPLAVALALLLPTALLGCGTALLPDSHPFTGRITSLYGFLTVFGVFGLAFLALARFGLARTERTDARAAVGSRLAEKAAWGAYIAGLAIASVLQLSGNREGASLGVWLAAAGALGCAGVVGIRAAMLVWRHSRPGCLPVENLNKNTA
ncbi:MAG: hypothetical protein IPL39_13345 [Opitutaceae bacterium]|nr:hypothetical protein [Opitutaceae bacterium]